MQRLLLKVNSLRNDPIIEVINKRILEFDSFRNPDVTSEELFKELCFCLLTANYAASPAMRIQEVLNDGFLTLSVDELAKELKALGHRFWPQRAERIVLAREIIPMIKQVLNTLNGLELRKWFVDNIKGLGLKEASHFLRNIGFKEYAIVDFHIIDILSDHGIIESIPKGKLTPKKYLEVENTLKLLSSESGLDLASLDLYLWYLETGKVLK